MTPFAVNKGSGFYARQDGRYRFDAIAVRFRSTSTVSVEQSPTRVLVRSAPRLRGTHSRAVLSVHPRGNTVARDAQVRERMTGTRDSVATTRWSITKERLQVPAFRRPRLAIFSCPKSNRSRGKLYNAGQSCRATPSRPSAAGSCSRGLRRVSQDSPSDDKSCLVCACSARSV